MSLFRRSAVESEAAPLNLRERWLDEHNRFLSKAFSGQAPVQRIPRVRVDRGGFTAMLRNSDTRKVIEQWWTRVLQATTLDD